VRCYERRHAMCTSIHPSFRPKRVSDATQDARTASPPTSTLVWDGQRGIRGSARGKERKTKCRVQCLFVGASCTYFKRDAFLLSAWWLFVVAGNSAECSLIRNSFALTLIRLDTTRPAPSPISSQYCILSLMRVHHQKRWMRAVMHLMFWHASDYAIDVSACFALMLELTVGFRRWKSINTAFSGARIVFFACFQKPENMDGTFYVKRNTFLNLFNFFLSIWIVNICKIFILRSNCCKRRHFTRVVYSV
jgi:hypothetical protein